MRAGTPAARIRNANAEAKCSQKPSRVPNRKSSTESRPSSAGSSVYRKRCSMKYLSARETMSAGIADEVVREQLAIGSEMRPRRKARRRLEREKPVAVVGLEDDFVAEGLGAAARRLGARGRGRRRCPGG